MWFGDLVTMRWWDDLWLNESFATFVSVLCQAQATRWTSAWTTFANIEKTWAYRQDQLPSTHPIAADIPDVQAVEVNFDGITYAKGASVLKQLAAYVGIEEFLRAMRVYFRRHEYGNTTLADLLRALAEESGRDLSQLVGRSGWRPPGSTRCGPSSTLDEQGRVHLVRDRCRAAAGPGRRAAARPPARDRALRRRRRQAGPHRAGRAGRDRRRGPRCRSWSATPGRTCCWSTTTT